MKKLSLIFIAIIIISAVLYSSAWYYMAGKINQHVTQFYKVNGPIQGISFYGEFPEISGFPFAPRITYKKGFFTKNYTANFDTLVVSGFPIPGQIITANILGKLYIQRKDLQKSIVLKQPMVQLIMPASVPKSSYQHDIQEWQEEVGKIEIIQTLLGYDDFLFKAKGIIGLDRNLQFMANLDTRTYGYESFINFFIYTGTIKPAIGALTLSGLNAVAQTDKTTNQKFVEMNLMVQNQQLSLGPIKLKNKFGKKEWPQKSYRN